MAATAPADPRQGWPLPAFGSMPQQVDLDEVASRVLAPNASHMTLDGTNTYVLAIPGSGAAVVVDPGPDDEAHRARVEEVLARRDLACEVVLITHHHIDHAAAGQPWARRFGATLAAPTRAVAGDDGRVIGEGDIIEVGGMKIDAIATPGHCSDHTAYRLPTGTMLTGDHVLGRGTSVVAWPEGDLVAYLESLRKVLSIGADALFPGHGPELTEDPMSVVSYYLEHRAFREQQIVDAMSDGIAVPREMVKRIYADVSERLWPAAEMSTRAALAKLSAEGRARGTGERGAPDERWVLTVN